LSSVPIFAANDALQQKNAELKAPQQAAE